MATTGGAGGVLFVHEASRSSTRGRTRIRIGRLFRSRARSRVTHWSGPRDPGRHNDGIPSRSPGEQRMWVIYLNVAIAVAIVAFFVVWTMRGRK
ncbi:MAG TPA: hypothetical protein VEY69_11810 [Lautropia sp.]|nr:hypothetical protein [Lautropia sp.]